jgi:hypothetical protein
LAAFSISFRSYQLSFVLQYLSVVLTVDYWVSLSLVVVGSWLSGVGFWVLAVDFWCRLSLTFSMVGA